MTRGDAEKAVRERWERLGLDWKAAPIMFSLDVDNMLAENTPCEKCGEVEDHMNHHADYTLDGEAWHNKDHEFQAAYRKQTGETGRSVPQFSDPAGE